MLHIVSKFLNSVRRTYISKQINLHYNKVLAPSILLSMQLFNSLTISIVALGINLVNSGMTAAVKFN